MNRINFIELLVEGGALVSSPFIALNSVAQNSSKSKPSIVGGLRTDLVIAGGGLEGMKKLPGHYPL